jgi:hypothetical protein
VTTWDVLTDSERISWKGTPLKPVGPLVFGMTPDEVESAVGADLRLSSTSGAASAGIDAMHFCLDTSSGARFPGSAVYAYFNEFNGLSGVAIDALWGPQLTLAEIPLLGQTPSILALRFAGHLMALDYCIRYSSEGEPCSPDLGVVLRVQRAGDLVLSRPIMVAERLDRPMLGRSRKLHS